MMQIATEVSSSATTASRDEVRNTEGPEAERHALKRTYLTLLPHTQLVELCLAFEAHSPAHIKNSLWPVDLAVAVTGLRSHAQTSQKTPTNNFLVPVPNASLSSTSSDATAQLSQTEASTTSSTNGTHPSSGASSHETPTADESPRPEQAKPADDSSRLTAQPLPSTSSTQSAAIAPLQGPYPHLSYGYPQTQPLSAYPHTPYYTYTHPHNFLPHPSAPYAHTAYPPSQPPYPTGQSPFPPFTGVPLARHPHSIGVTSAEHGGIPADDLPSYEDMLVEALTDLNEADGSAPKSLFTWMASRYPLHSNFRPSASQALQKAFKRGRLEKGSNGKYRLNASWDGGSTSKRTTRRPQTIGQSAVPAPPGAPTSSPFTHTPLAHVAREGLPFNSSSPVPAAAQGKPPHYTAYPYQYTSGGAYPGYALSEPPPVSKDKTPVEPGTAPTQESAGGNNAANADVEEGSDAWEAAQTILKAINFGSLLQASVAKPPVPAVSPLSPSASSAPSGSTVPDRRLAPPVIVDDNAAAGPIQVSSNRDRASLQAQLALLAAQLAEIAEDTLASDLNVPGANRCAEERGDLAGDEEQGQDEI
ncbi:hypothetical protein EDB87DRAFT_1595977 [Lactarius vividus]|nr:hypothetical protein EDB87DRAFT_1595977 [Lactarius vividus]